MLLLHHIAKKSLCCKINIIFVILAVLVLRVVLTRLCKLCSFLYSYLRFFEQLSVKIVERCGYDFRKYSFSTRITNIWKSLPDEIIPAQL